MTSALVISPAKVEQRAGGPCEAQPLHVLTLTPFYPSEHHPAQGCFVFEPLFEFGRHEVTHSVIAVEPFYRGRARPLLSRIECRAYDYFSIPGNLGLPLSGEFLAAGLISRVSKMDRERPFDLIHAHSALPCGAAALQVSKKLGIPFVVTVHGLDAYSKEQSGRYVGKWCELVSRRVYEAASAVICISDRVRQQVATLASARTIVVYNGVDESVFSPEPERTSLPVLLSVGNLIPSKGHALLLRAFARIAHYVPNYSVEIIGEGPERTSLARLASELGIQSRVHFLGRRSRREVAAAMKRCTVFVLPSSYEGLGCVYLEAMASGKPAIGCYGQGIEEIIQHGRNGLLISPDSESDLSAALATLLSDRQLCCRLGLAARDTVLSRYTLAHQASQLTAAYRECM